MSELDGVTLSQSEIWLARNQLEMYGLIETTTVHSQLAMKLTGAGDLYCRETIFPGLFAETSSTASELAAGDINFGEEVNAKEEALPAGLEFLKGLSIVEIFDLINADPALRDRLARLKPAAKVISESAREPVRTALVRVAREIDSMNLPNFEGAQSKAHVSIAVILTDAPAGSKEDIGQQITLACSIVSAASAAGALLVATLAYLAQQST